MWSFSRVYLVFLLVGAILSSSSNAQPTVDDSSSCQSSTSDEAVSRMRNELQGVKKLLGSVLNLLRSVQQQNLLCKYIKAVSLLLLHAPKY